MIKKETLESVFLYLIQLVLYTVGMESVLQSDIFFFITSIAVVIVAIAVVLVLVQLFRILRSVRRISEHVEDEVQNARGTFGEIREQLAAIPGLSFLSRKRTAARKRAKTKAQ